MKKIASSGNLNKLQNAAIKETLFTDRNAKQLEFKYWNITPAHKSIHLETKILLWVTLGLKKNPNGNYTI